MLTDYGKKFTDHHFSASKCAASGNYDFDPLCRDLIIERRLAPSQLPQTNEIGELFNSCIENVLRPHHFRSGEELEFTLLCYGTLFNQQPPLSAMGGQTPLQAMKGWHGLEPYHFSKCDT